MQQVTNAAQILSNLQRMQDLLAERLEIGLVLIDPARKEITIPSKMPIACFRCREVAACTDGLCARAGSDATSICTEILPCSEGCHTFAVRTAFVVNGQPALLIGRTRSRGEELGRSVSLIEGVFSLPVAFDGAPADAPAAAPGDGWQLRGLLGTLSPQELNVLVLIGHGLPNKEIAAQLHVSLSTVKSHVSRLLRKLNLSSRTDVAIFALNSGLMKREPGDD